MSDIPQQVYPEYQGLGIEGAAADMSPRSAVTGVNESEAMPAGRIVVFDTGGSDDRSVELPAATGGKVVGLTQFSQVMESYDLTGVAQVSTVTVGGTATDGTYTIPLDINDTGEEIPVSVVRTGGVPATNNDIAAAFRTAINGNAQIAGRVQAAGAGADVVITKTTPGSFVVGTLVAPAPGTLTGALTTSGEADHIPANEAANIATAGCYWVRPEDAVTPASGVFFRHTANAGVGTALGALRGSADGGNTDQISNGAEWLTSAAAGALAKLKLNLPG